MPGYLELIIGCMYSGKSTRLIEIYEQLIDQLNDADQDFPDLVEAKDFLSSF